MKDIDIATLKELTEGQDLEFKESLSLKKEGFKSLCAMVNSDSATGKVYFGVTDEGEPKGIEPGNIDSAQKKIVDYCQQKVDPPLNIEIEVANCDGKFLLIISATRNRATPYHEFDGRAYIREGSSNKQLGLDDKNNLVKGRDRDSHNGPWQCDTCHSFVGVLVSPIITNQGYAGRSYVCQDCGGEYWPI